MRTTKRFDMALSALVGAFFTSTLVKGACTACAVGNIVAKGNGIKIKSIDFESAAINGEGIALMAARGAQMGFDNFHTGSWGALFMTHEQQGQIARLTPEDQKQAIDNRETSSMRLAAAYVAIKPTGYSADELSQVETAFEQNTKITHHDYPKHSEDEIKEDQFNGLVAVVEVLCQLDGMSVEDTNTAKEAFDYVHLPQFEPANRELVDSLLVGA